MCAKTEAHKIHPSRMFCTMIGSDLFYFSSVHSMLLATHGIDFRKPAMNYHPRFGKHRGKDISAFADWIARFGGYFMRQSREGLNLEGKGMGET